MTLKNIILVFALLILLSAGVSAVTINSISLTPSSGKAPLTVKMDADISGSGSYIYSWDTGDSFTTTKSSFSHEFSDAGTYTITLSVTDSSDNSTDTETKSLIVSKAEKITLSVSANPVSGNAPLAVSFAAAASGEDSFTYNWDFNNDGTTDSTNKNPSYTYNIPGTYEAKLTITDNAGNTASDSVKVYVTKFDPKINVDSYSPTSMKLNSEVTMSIIVANIGNEYLTNIDAKTISDKVTFKKSTTISSLAPNDKDVITINFVPISAGKFSIPVKIMGKNFNLAVEVIDENAKYDANTLQTRVDSLKTEVNSMYNDCLAKQKAGYLVGDTCNSLSELKSSALNMEADLSAGKLSAVNNALVAAQPKLDDFKQFLADVQKPKKSIFEILKENALFITTIAASIAALSGIIAKIKAKTKVIREKVHSHIKKTFAKDKEITAAATEAKEEHKKPVKPKKTKKK